VLCVALPAGAADKPATLYKRARAAAEKGAFTEAYLLANQAIALDPGNQEYWSYAQALRVRGLDGVKVQLPAVAPPPHQGADSPGEASTIAEEDLREARELLPPPFLRPNSSVFDVDLQGDSRQLFEEVSKKYGLQVVFDGDYQPVRRQRFRLDRANASTALRALESVTASFIVPVSEKIFLVANDTSQKRQQVEPVMAVVISYPTSLTVQEVQEGARAVQSTFEISKMGVDTQRRLVLFRDRVSRIRPAVELFEQLLTHRGQFEVEVELLGVNANSNLSYGVNFQTSYPLVYFGSNRLDLSGPSNPPSSSTDGNYLLFGGGSTLFGLGLTSTDLFAAMTRLNTKFLNRSQLLTLEGQPATLHLGDRYPIITQQFAGDVQDNSYRPPPTVQFEDLGVVVKVTGWLHGDQEVTLDVDAEYKVLAGQTFNEIPVISNRKFVSRVRMKFGQSAVMAGLITLNRSRTTSGFPLLAEVTPFGSNTRDTEMNQILLVLTPRLSALPASETLTRPIWTGTESRPLTPLD
jgi:type II secretory pathway component GspD/PulD (secretin)